MLDYGLTEVIDPLLQMFLLLLLVLFLLGMVDILAKILDHVITVSLSGPTPKKEQVVIIPTPSTPSLPISAEQFLCKGCGAKTSTSVCPVCKAFAKSLLEANE